MQKIRTAVIPAAGRNSRMQNIPLSKILPKPMMPILNKPILHYIVEMLIKNEVYNLYFIVNNKKELIEGYFGDGKEYGVSIKYIYQEELHGIGHAVSLTEQFITEPFLVILGDTFIPELALEPIINIFFERKALAVEAIVRETNHEALTRSCNVEIGPGNKIEKLIEKPTNPSTEIRGTGIYLFDPKIFEFIKIQKESNIRNEIEITDTLNSIAKLGRCYGVELKIPDININTVDELIRATEYMLSRVHIPLKGVP